MAVARIEEYVKLIIFLLYNHGNDFLDFKHLYVTIISLTDEFKGHSLLQAAREADLAKVKKTLALEIINFKQPQSHETALVRSYC